MSEHHIERKAVAELQKMGCAALKFGQDGWPDRLVALGRDYPNAVLWIEFKTPDGAVRPAQKVRHKQLAAVGQTVAICRSWQEAVGVVAKARRAFDRAKSCG